MRPHAAYVLLTLLPACSPAIDVPADTDDLFVVGGDISFLPEIEDHGGAYSDADGAGDLLDLMKDHGFDAIRLKLWHTPEQPYNTLDRVAEMALRARTADLRLLLDIHYSDSWADPQKQIKPAAWDSLTFDALTDSVYAYTRSSVQALVEQGTPPWMVQIGNEIRPGMLWPDGRVDGEWDTPEQWDRLAALLAAGRQGVLDASGDLTPQIMIHFDNGAKNEMGRAFFDRLAERDVAFDVIGLSFYPKWHGTLDELTWNLADLSARYGKDVYVVETAYPWTFEHGDDANNILGTESDLHQGYPPTVQGQSDFLAAVTEAVRGVPGQRGRGVFYWAPEWIAVPGVDSHWENATLFDFDGRMLPSLDVFTGGGSRVP